jgi:hypothetical protein
MTMGVRSPTSHEPTDSSLDDTTSFVCEADLTYADLAAWQLSPDYRRNWLPQSAVTDRHVENPRCLSGTLLRGVTDSLEDDSSADFYGVIGESFVVAA